MRSSFSPQCAASSAFSPGSVSSGGAPAPTTDSGWFRNVTAQEVISSHIAMVCATSSTA